MKNDLKFGFRMFVQNLKMNSLVVLQIALALCLGFSLLSCISAVERSSQIFRNFKNAKAVYYDDTTYLDTATMRALGVEAEDVDGRLTEPLEQVKFRSMVTKTTVLFDEKDVELYGMDHNLASLFDIPVTKGVWLDKAESNSVIQAVVSPNSGLKVGETATLSYFDEDEDGNIQRNPMSIHVVGILSNPILIPSPGCGGIPNSFSFCESEVNVDKNTAMMIISTDTLPASTVEKLNAFKHVKSEYIVFEDDIDDATYQHNLDLIAKKGEMATPSEMIEQDELYLKTELAQYLPMEIIFLVLSLLGVVCSAFFCINNNLHNFSVYFVCGSTWKHCKRMIAGYLTISVGCILVFVWVLSVIVNTGWIAVLPGFALTPQSVWYMVAVLLLYVVGFMGIAYYQLSHNSPVSILKSTTE